MTQPPANIVVSAEMDTCLHPDMYVKAFKVYFKYII